MALFEWDDKFSVGNNTMDSHHKRLFDILNTIHEAAKEGRGEEIIEGSLNELASYTKYHFDEEDKLMVKSNYPHLEAQRQAHTAFLNKIQEFQDEVAKGNGLFVVTNVAVTVKDWLKQHILTMDMQYEDYLRGL
ncbi:MAG: bacteriohemerythrin [Pseudomonadota bacterium]